MWSTDTVGANQPVVTFRTDRVGGGPLNKPRSEEEAYSRRYRYVYLIHGYNATEREATENYERMRGRLVASSARLSKELLYLYWPGDSAVPLLRGAMYGRAVKVARQVARAVAEHLSRRRAPGGARCDVILVAHSLGCRLVLEALKQLDMLPKNPSQPRLSIILMAAAIPVEDVSGDVDARNALGNLTDSAVFYSAADKILARAFRFGERLRGWNTGSREAVGLYGNPADAKWMRNGMEGYDHSDYWPGELAADAVSQFLGLSATRSKLRKRHLVRRASLEWSLAAVQSRSLRRHILASRQLKRLL